MRHFFDRAAETARDIWDESNWIIRGAVILIALGALYSVGAAIVEAL